MLSDLDVDCGCCDGSGKTRFVDCLCCDTAFSIDFVVAIDWDTNTK